MAAETSWIPRFERREGAQRRLVRRAALAVAILEFSVAIVLNPEPLLRLFRPEVPLGLPGPSNPGDLAPPGDDQPGRRTPSWARGYRSTVRLVRPVILGSPEPSPPPPAQSATRGRYVPLTPRAGGRGLARGGGDSVRVELDEAWNATAGSSDVARTGKFRIMQLRRPDYPAAAIRQGMEGLVKLEVRVDVRGLVEDVRVLQSPPAGEALQRAAVEAIYDWRFHPYQVGSDVMPFTLIVPFRFRLIG